MAGPTAYVAAVHRIHDAAEALERNPNEPLLLQALLWSLPAAPASSGYRSASGRASLVGGPITTAASSRAATIDGAGAPSSSSAARPMTASATP